MSILRNYHCSSGLPAFNDKRLRYAGHDRQTKRRCRAILVAVLLILGGRGGQSWAVTCRCRLCHCQHNRHSATGRPQRAFCHQQDRSDSRHYRQLQRGPTGADGDVVQRPDAAFNRRRRRTCWLLRRSLLPAEGRRLRRVRRLPSPVHPGVVGEHQVVRRHCRSTRHEAGHSTCWPPHQPRRCLPSIVVLVLRRLVTRRAGRHINLAAVYRPPSSSSYGVSVGSFCTEFADFLDELLLLPRQPVICGDFNCPGRDSASIDKQLSDMLISRSLDHLI